MKILTRLDELPHIPGDIFLAIGVFDGVHLGHQAVLKQTIADAKSAGGIPIMLTFHPHPLKVLQPARAPHLLTSTPHKELLAECYGISQIVEIPFDQSFAETTPEAFIQSLVHSCKKKPYIAQTQNPPEDSVNHFTTSSATSSQISRLRQICVGHQWTFGKNRAGNVTTLRQLGQQLGFTVVEVPQVLVDGEIVSSTRIRTAITRGNFSEAERCLGRPYTILGDVIHGAHLGRSIGVPTANLSTHSEQFPPNGVYIVQAHYKGTAFPAVANIGNRPTIVTTEPSRVLEIHILDFDKDLYGEQLEVQFFQFIRPECKFPSLDALREQIVKDIATAREYFSG